MFILTVDRVLPIGKNANERRVSGGNYSNDSRNEFLQIESRSRMAVPSTGLFKVGKVFTYNEVLTGAGNRHFDEPQSEIDQATEVFMKTTEFQDNFPLKIIGTHLEQLQRKNNFSNAIS